MNPDFLVLVLALALAIFVGRDLGKWLFGANEKLVETKLAAQKLATILRSYGLKYLPSMLDSLVMGNVPQMFETIKDLAKIIEAGNEAILKELEATYEAVLQKKLSTPEGLSFLKMKVAEAEKTLANAA